MLREESQMTTRNSTTQPSHEDAQTIQKLLVGVIGLINTFSADQRTPLMRQPVRLEPEYRKY